MDFSALFASGGAFLTTLREGIEAALIIGILYTYVAAKNDSRAKRAILMGVGVALVLSVLFAVVLVVVTASIPDTTSMLLEGVLLLIAAGFLLYMVLWMNHAGIGRELRLKVDTAVATATPVASVFWVAFTSVLREGIETVVFLEPATNVNAVAYVGAVLGLATAGGIGYLLFAAGRKLPMKQIFSFTTLLIVLFAATLVFDAFGEFKEYSEQTKAGEIYETVFGTLGIVGALAVLGWGLWRWNKQR